MVVVVVVVVVVEVVKVVEEVVVQKQSTSSSSNNSNRRSSSSESCTKIEVLMTQIIIISPSCITSTVTFYQSSALNHVNIIKVNTSEGAVCGVIV